ncbi:MAG TPA: DsbA family protein [Chitinophagaceae bacterium]
MTIIYCYDAYCGWCYGFSPVIRKIAEEYADRLTFEVFSGGMIVPETPRHISVTAGYIQKAYKTVEDYSGVQFGQDYLWHVFNADKSDWFPHSEKPAIALCVFKDLLPGQQVQFAADLQYALHFEGRDLTDNEAYRHLLEKYNIPAEEFYEKLKSREYRDKAYYEFALVKQLQVTGFPTVLLQVSETKFYLLAKGFTPYDTFKERIESVLADAAKLK